MPSHPKMMGTENRWIIRAKNGCLARSPADGFDAHVAVSTQ